MCLIIHVKRRPGYLSYIHDPCALREASGVAGKLGINNKSDLCSLRILAPWARRTFHASANMGSALFDLNHCLHLRMKSRSTTTQLTQVASSDVLVPYADGSISPNFCKTVL